jgi:hypothetical protein
MSEDTSGSDRALPSSAPRVGESPADYRERMALIQTQALERRRQELSEQRSPLNTPADRIRIWERLHQLPLPRNSAHRLVTLIATDTDLSVEDVLAEQRLRAAAKNPAAAG